MRYMICITSDGKTVAIQGYTYPVIDSLLATVERVLSVGLAVCTVDKIVPGIGDQYLVTYSEA